MLKKWYLVFCTLVLYRVSLSTFELPGQSGLRKKPIGKNELQSMFGEELSTTFYWSFEKAVKLQEEDYAESARKLYKALLASIEKNEELYERVLPYIRFNMSMLGGSESN